MRVTDITKNVVLIAAMVTGLILAVNAEGVKKGDKLNLIKFDKGEMFGEG